MSDFYVAVGDTTTFSKTVGEYDVYSFAGISGDFAPNHVNKAYMEKSSYGRADRARRVAGRLYVDRLDADGDALTRRRERDRRLARL